MIISKTPFRISFFGGGTDYPVWIKEHGGEVLGTTIDKYAYISCRYLPPFFEHNYRIVYSIIENAISIDDLKHPAVRECIRFSNINKGLEIHHDSDLPAKSGLGSSSTFTVGLLNCLNSLKGGYTSKKSLVANALHVEQKLIGENVGCQDQVHAAYGGFNRIKFYPDGNIEVIPVVISSDVKKDLQSHFLLFFTGFSRFASDIASEQIKKTPEKTKELNHMQEMVTEALKILNKKNTNINEFGQLLHESWALKRSLTDKITSPAINNIYDTGIAAGASGGKLLGAGGGGFILFVAKPQYHDLIKQKLKGLLHVSFNFESSGSSIIFYNP